MYKGTEFDVGEVVRFAVLGPVRAWRGGVELDLGTPQQRALLAALLLREGAQASMGELSEALWGGAEPDASAAVVRMYVARLRRALDE
jgi:DNA-binding SARP family transcriptional activator